MIASGIGSANVVLFLEPLLGRIISLAAVAAVVLGFIALFALFAVWVERKVSARMQCRVGPMEVGPHGLLQTIADAGKLLVKEDLIPRLADRALFIVAPIIVFTGVFARFVPLPFGDGVIAGDLNVGLYFIAAVGAVEVIGIIMAGWSSNNKWSLFGTIRSATQMISYELPIGIAFLAVIASAGTMQMTEIIRAQAGWISAWAVFANPFLALLAFIYYAASLAEVKRAPFDLPEAESELVSGYHTEYSGMRFAFFFLAEYAAMYLVSAIGVVCVLGGWYVGIPAIDAIGEGRQGIAGFLGGLMQVGVLVGKAMALVFVQMWLRWTLPRVRLDQMMHLCLKLMLPFSFVFLLGSCLWELWAGPVLRGLWFVLAVAGLAAAVVFVLLPPGRLKGSRAHGTIA